MSTSDHAGFHRAIEDVIHSGDILPHLVYADYLEEHGFPAVAQHIRLAAEEMRDGSQDPMGSSSNFYVRGIGLHDQMHRVGHPYFDIGYGPDVKRLWVKMRHAGEPAKVLVWGRRMPAYDANTTAHRMHDEGATAQTDMKYIPRNPERMSRRLLAFVRRFAKGDINRAYNQVFIDKANEMHARLSPEQQAAHLPSLEHFNSLDHFNIIKHLVRNNDDLAHNVVTRMLYGTDKTPGSFIDRFDPTKGAKLGSWFRTAAQWYAREEMLKDRGARRVRGGGADRWVRDVPLSVVQRQQGKQGAEERTDLPGRQVSQTMMQPPPRALTPQELTPSSWHDRIADTVRNAGPQGFLKSDFYRPESPHRIPTKYPTIQKTIQELMDQGRVVQRTAAVRPEGGTPVMRLYAPEHAPPDVNPQAERNANIARMRSEGMSLGQIMQATGLSKGGIQKILRQTRLARRGTPRRLNRETLTGITQSMRANPRDHTHHLVLADLYEEMGKPALAAHIRASVEGHQTHGHGNRHDPPGFGQVEVQEGWAGFPGETVAYVYPHSRDFYDQAPPPPGDPRTVVVSQALFPDAKTRARWARTYTEPEAVQVMQALQDEGVYSQEPDEWWHNTRQGSGNPFGLTEDYDAQYRLSRKLRVRLMRAERRHRRRYASLGANHEPLLRGVAAGITHPAIFADYLEENDHPYLAQATRLLNDPDHPIPPSWYRGTQPGHPGFYMTFGLRGEKRIHAGFTLVHNGQTGQPLVNFVMPDTIDEMSESGEPARLHPPDRRVLSIATPELARGLIYEAEHLRQFHDHNEGAYTGIDERTRHPDQVWDVVRRHLESPPAEQRRYAAYQAPAGGAVVRGSFYQGGMTLPNLQTFADPNAAVRGMTKARRRARSRKKSSTPLAAALSLRLQ